MIEKIRGEFSFEARALENKVTFDKSINRQESKRRHHKSFHPKQGPILQVVLEIYH